jgi:uncharacterized protein YndB with AHSA1/START domain
MRVALMMALALAGPAHAEVKSATDSGFRLENRITVAATPERAWVALGEIGRWWNSAHTYSGDALNMTMPLKVGGCFCEALPGGGVEHGRVIMVWPEQKMVRLQSALGPLQDEGVEAVLTFQVKPAPGGAEIVQTYNVGGARPEMVKAAPLIDQVVGEQLGRLKTYLEP